MFNERAKATYIGVTNNLRRRIDQHKSNEIPGYSKDHKTDKLAYFETYSDIDVAIAREKALKKWKRSWKFRMIETMNPEWIDLSEVKD